MNTNPSLVTSTGRQAAALQTQGYGDTVAAHVGGDWAGHTQINVYPVAYLDNAGDTVGGYTLRLLATHDANPLPVDAVLAVPVIVTGSTPGAEGAAPILISQTTSASAAAGSLAEMAITVISGFSVTYQWYKAVLVSGVTTDEAVPGAVYSKLVFSSVSAENAGQYRCVATNVYGSVASAYIELTVT